MQWNAEGVYKKKKTERQHFLQKRDINACYIQEIHLQPAKSIRSDYTNAS